MTKYGPKGLMIYQVNNDGTGQGTTPTTAQLEGWVKTYKAAGISTIDPRRNVSKFYYDGSGKVGIPYNIIIDAKTRKVLVKKVGLSQVESTIAKYLN